MSSVAAPTLESSATVSRELGRFVEQLAYDAIPETVRIRAKHLILDAVGIALASNRFEFADVSVAALADLGGAGEASVIGRSERLPLRDAVLANGILVHGLDYDDTHVPGVIHATASAFPCTLGVAEHVGSSGRDLLTAYVAAVEAATRVATAAEGGFHKMGFHPTGLVGAFGCALAAGRLLGLDAERLAMAQGIALSMAAASMEFLEEGAWTKRMHPGWAGVAGITAAYLARGGFVGPSAAYEGRFGLYATHLDPRDPPVDAGAAAADLGSSWELQRVAVKPFPACHLVHGCADAALALKHEHDLDPEAITSVTALVPEQAIPIICEPVATKLAPATDYDAKFSVQYTIAASLCRGRFGLEELEEEALRDPRIRSLAGKVRYAADPDSPFPNAYSGEVVVETKDGRRLRHREHINRGADQRPLSNGEIAAKYLENACILLDAARAERVRDAVLALDELADARALTEVLRHG